MVRVHDDFPGNRFPKCVGRPVAGTGAMTSPAWLPWLFAVLAMLGQPQALADETSPTFDEAFERFGQLESADSTPVFLADMLENGPSEPIHHFANQVIVTEQSLTTGWARLLQCHHDLDEVSRAQIVYRPDGIRALTVTEATQVQQAWTEEHTVQLRGVGPGARLCIEAEGELLVENADGSYSVFNGPFMRRFLDSYFPIRVSQKTRYPEQLRFVSMTPSPRPGLELAQGPNEVSFDTIFRGRLNTELRFERVDSGP